MKQIKQINNLVAALLTIVILSVALSMEPVGFPVVYTLPVLFFFAFILPLIKKLQVKGSLFAGLYREAWDRELIKRFNTAEQGSWRNGIRDLGQYFNMLQDGEVVVVNLAYWGVSPDVLINNTSYPIAIQSLDGENLVVTINKFQTKATPVTDDEIMGLNYDKMRVVQESHALTVIENKDAMGIHNIAPSANTTDLPVLKTSGDLVSGRRMMIRKDLISLKRQVDNLLHPETGRRLVLCPDHVNDLLEIDPKFKDQYYDNTSAKVYNMLGFDFYYATRMPYYNASTLAKLSFGGVVVDGTHTKASVYFHLTRVVQGKGFTKNYMSLSGQDPLNQRSLYNIRHYDIVTRYKNEGAAAICSAVS